VNSVAPGPVWTPLIPATFPGGTRMNAVTLLVGYATGWQVC
jgi:NAD(P)-dependent dehydrogenase (short-subunit alcohol dehydrogenase family)